MMIVAGCGGPSPGEFDPTEISLVEVPGRNLMELTTDSLTFVDSRGVKWVAPAGTWTDGATVPRVALWITDGRFQKEFLKAAIVHDAYCQDFNKTRCPQQFKKRPWREVHRMFFEACVAGKTPLTKAKMMFAAVWWGGPRWDDPSASLKFVPDRVLTAGYQGCKKFIEETDPTLEAIEDWLDSREPTVREISELQLKYFNALNIGDQQSVNQLLEKTEKRLEKALEKLPEDLMLLNLKGYHHKNCAINYQQQKMFTEFDTELNKSQEIFQDIVERDPQNASALNGLGSVAILRQDLDQAENYIQKALKIEPDYIEAKEDMKLIQKVRTLQSNREPAS